MSDRELATTICAGDFNAAEYLLTERCRSSLLHLINGRFASSRLEFDEVVNELYALLARHSWKALRDFQGANADGKRCSISTYVGLIATRHISRKLGAVKEIDWNAALTDQDGGPLPLPDPSNETRRGHATVDIIDAIMSLRNPKEQLVLLKYKIEGVPVEEVARMLNPDKPSVGAVYTTCSRAISRMREVLTDGEPHDD